MGSFELTTPDNGKADFQIIATKDNTGNVSIVVYNNKVDTKTPYLVRSYAGDVLSLVNVVMDEIGVAITKRLMFPDDYKDDIVEMKY